MLGLAVSSNAQETASPCTVISGPRGKIVPKDPMSQTRVTFSVRNCGEVKGIEATSDEFAGVVFSDITPTATRVTANVTADHTTLAGKKIGLRLVLSDGTRVETPKFVSLIAYSNEGLRIRDETLNATSSTSKRVEDVRKELEMLRLEVADIGAITERVEEETRMAITRSSRAEIEALVAQALAGKGTSTSTETRLKKLEQAFEALRVAQVATSENLEYLSETRVKKPGGFPGIGRSEQLSYVAVKKEQDNRKTLLTLLDELRSGKTRQVHTALNPQEER